MVAVQQALHEHQIGVNAAKDLGGDSETGKDSGFIWHQRGTGLQVGRDEGSRGDIGPSRIFCQRTVDGGIKFAATWEHSFTFGCGERGN